MQNISIEISDDARALIQAMRDYITPFIVPVAGTAIGYVAGQKRMIAEAHKFDAEATAATAEALKFAAEAEAAKLDSITRHFEALLQGYEERIRDLVNEVDSLRAEVLALRKALDQRPKPKG